MAPFQLREPPLILAYNEAPTNNQKGIVFKHPAYPDEFMASNLLFLHAWDHTDGGLHAQTALLACQIVACNAWDGYLTTHRGGEMLEIHDGTILTAPEYYFYVPGPSEDGSSAYNYPVYPSFQHWVFPHGNLPLSWRVQNDALLNQQSSNSPSLSSVSSAVVNRDGACVVSRDLDYLERAHLCPRSETEWFTTNEMSLYSANYTNAGATITDDMANAISLRADIHRAFDDHRFVFVRKGDRWVAHFLNNTKGLGRKLHNVSVDVDSSVRPEFMLTRFAWAIFPFVKKFMCKGPERLVKVRETNDKGIEKEVVKTWSRNEAEQLGNPGRRRSTSPITETKRRRTSDEILAAYDLHGVSDSRSDDGESSSGATSISLPHGTSSLRPPPDTTSVDEPPSTLPTQELRKPPVSSSLLDKSEEERFSTLRIRELRKRRPDNPDLFCCDYNFAEYANSHGISGKREHGGAHLCLRCLGAETDPMQDLPDPDASDVMGIK